MPPRYYMVRTIAEQRCCCWRHLQLVAKVFRQGKELCEGSIDGRSRSKRHIVAQVVVTLSATLAAAARNARLHRHAVTDLEGGHLVTDLCDDAGRFMPEDHWLLNLEMADFAMVPDAVSVAFPDGHIFVNQPVVDIRTADTRPLHVDLDIVRRLQLRNGAIFEAHVFRLLKHKREVLLCGNQRAGSSKEERSADN